MLSYFKKNSDYPKIKNNGLDGGVLELLSGELLNGS